ncbi:hypothetical protein D3C84_594140 [compost metagenome]|uniref:hypothetical protein n=1 Tax=Pseudomonas sp. TNT2022 ID1044 TaxID=2942636 RepID=UPI000FB12DCA|nr:hypothetical protein [Pseudomonas sp. TNT2022 ID1044]MDD0998950.1 hypothetical protein [Pseudomonas sp. TNT2022 ID1044]
MKGLTKAILVTLGMMGGLQCLAAEIAFSSATDFREISLNLKRADDPIPPAINLQVTLSPDAQRRMAQLTRENLYQPLTLFINGVHVSTSTIQAAVEGPALMIALPPETARHLLPTLVEP